jgi:hypothetical protein
MKYRTTAISPVLKIFWLQALWSMSLHEFALPSSNQTVSYFLQNQKFRFRIDRTYLLVSMLCRMNRSPWFCVVYFNILPPTCRSINPQLSFGFRHSSLCLPVSHLFNECRVSRPDYLRLFIYLNNCDSFDFAISGTEHGTSNSWVIREHWRGVLWKEAVEAS